jgi:hypothetical protein
MPVTEYGDNDARAQIEMWQESIDRRIGMVQDGFEASIESIEARLSGSAPHGIQVSAPVPDPITDGNFEQQIDYLDQRLTEMIDTNTEHLRMLEYSMELLRASGKDSPVTDTTPVAHTADAIQPALQQQSDQASRDYEARIRQLEKLFAEAQTSSTRRIEAIEHRLEFTAQRMESFAANRVDTTAAPEDSESVMAANEAIHADPPAAVQHKIQETATDRDQETTEPVPVVEIPQESIRTETPVSRPVWSINLASYARERDADMRLEDFRQQGVSAEKRTATVRGRTMYRLRVTGYDSMQAARANSPAIRHKLGLEEVWISRD